MEGYQSHSGPPEKPSEREANTLRSRRELASAAHQTDNNKVIYPFGNVGRVWNNRYRKKSIDFGDFGVKLNNKRLLKPYLPPVDQCR